MTKEALLSLLEALLGLDIEDLENMPFVDFDEARLALALNGVNTDDYEAVDAAVDEAMTVDGIEKRDGGLLVQMQDRSKWRLSVERVED